MTEPPQSSVCPTVGRRSLEGAPTPHQSDGELLSGWLGQAALTERLAARFAELAEAVSAAVIVATRSRVVFASSAVSRVLGHPIEHLARVPLPRLIAEPASRRTVRAALRAAWTGRPADVPAIAVIRGDGTIGRIAITLRPLAGELEPTLLAVIHACGDGNASSAAPVTAAGIGHDPLRALGLHLAALASDLRGPLTAYRDHLDGLVTRTDLPRDVRDSLALYETVTTEALERLGRALEWGRRGPLHERVDLATVVHAAMAALAPGPGVVRLRLEPVPPVAGIADQLQLAVEHLVKNAIEATRGREGAITVRLRAEGTRALLTVTDEGGGIPSSLFPFVFEPFSSSKSIAIGLGLGLPIVRDIVERHRGHVSIESHAGGTTVTVGLDGVGSSEASDRQGRRRVVLLDDNPFVRETYRALLGESGWDVRCAADAEEAIEIVGLGGVDALLVDVQMAGRDGLAVLEALAQWHPHLVRRVALHTGYADEERVRATAARYGVTLLEKPCRAETLLATLDKLSSPEGGS